MFLKVIWAQFVKGASSINRTFVKKPLFCSLLIENSWKSKKVLKSCPCSSQRNDRWYGWNLWCWRTQSALEWLIAKPHAICMVLTCGLFAIPARTAASFAPCIMDLLQWWFGVFQLSVMKRFRQTLASVWVDSVSFRLYFTVQFPHWHISSCFRHK